MKSIKCYTASQPLILCQAMRKNRLQNIKGLQNMIMYKNHITNKIMKKESNNFKSLLSKKSLNSADPIEVIIMNPILLNISSLSTLVTLPESPDYK